jgi:hypothetical protein
MVGYGWHTIDAAPGRAASPTLMTPPAGAGDAIPRARSRTRVRRIALFVPALRSLAAPPDVQRARRYQAPPRWPDGAIERPLRRRAGA